MEEQIKRKIFRLKCGFVCFWILPVLFIVWGETDPEWIGLYVGNARIAYYAETIVILLTALCVPFSLKLFAWVLRRKIDAVSIADALQLYEIWSTIRLILLALPLWAGLVMYYLLLSNKSLLCALIAFTASLFCLPGEKRLRNELHIDKEV